MRLNQLVIQLFCWAGVLLLPWKEAQACKCAGEPTVKKAFQNSDVVLQATLLKELKSADPLVILFSAKIVRALKGCQYFNGTSTTTVKTNSESAACGVSGLKTGKTFFLSGQFDQTTKSVSVNSCGFQKLWSTLTAAEKKDVEALSKNYSTCGCTAKGCGARLGSTCKKQSDCRANQFCSAGKCSAYGSCADDLDCLNPANKFVTKCSGITTCQKSKCLVICSSLCPNGDPPVKCFQEPCKANTCKEPHVSCADDYCGGCNSIFYNSAGDRVCSKSSCPNGAPPVQCFQEPCKANTCNEKYVACVDNYCGGCYAIFYNSSGDRVCSK